LASVSPTACTRSVPTRRSRALGLRIAEYKAGRLAVRRGGKPLTAAAANQPLGLLRNLLRQALRWKIIPEVPEIEFEDEPALQSSGSTTCVTPPRPGSSSRVGRCAR